MVLETDQRNTKWCGLVRDLLDTDLDRSKDGDDNASKENNDLKRCDTPETVKSSGRGDEITDSVDDDCCKTGIGNVEEDCLEKVDGEKDEDARNDTGQRRADTSFRLDGRPGEGASSRVGAEEGTKDVGDADSDKLLRWVDGVIVDAAE